jgi:uncharacterized protein (TIGR02284 family)
MNHQDIVSTLNDLIETSKDGEYGFSSSAENAKGQHIKQLFVDRADGCRQAASELQRMVVQYGGDAEDGGSATGALHRGWVAVRSALAGYTDLALLEEAERGEDMALASYRKALEKELPADVRSVIETQLHGVKRNHDQIRSLRNQAREMAT